MQETSLRRLAASQVGYDVPHDALGFIITYSVFALIIVGYTIQGTRRFGRHSRSSTITNENILLNPLKQDLFGSSLLLATCLFIFWLLLVMALTCIGQYMDKWLLGGNITEGVSFDSYTSVLIMAWTCLAFIVGFGKLLLDRAFGYFMTPCDLADCDHVVVTQSSEDESGALSKFQILAPVQTTRDGKRFFDFHLRRYFWSIDRFQAAHAFHSASPTLAEIRNCAGLSSTAAAALRDRIGDNSIDIPVPSFTRTVIAEFSTFFYAYQFLAIWIPLYWDYVTLSIFQICLITSAGMLKVFLERKRRLELKALVSICAVVQVKRDGQWQQIPSESLVPGDLVKIENSAELLTCDAALVSGQALTDESLLTGETMPVQKQPLPDDAFPGITVSPDSAGTRKSIVFAGSCVVSASDVTAVVTHTGAETVRASLLRSLLFGSGLQMHQEWFQIALVLLLLGSIVLLIGVLKYSGSWQAILAGLNSATVLINPLLPVAVMGGQLSSSRRLLKHRVFCRDLERLTLAGGVDTVCLDKTGTITKGGLDFFQAQPLPGVDGELVAAAMAMTHSLSRVSGVLIGHQVELLLAQEAVKRGWDLENVHAPRDPGGHEWRVDKVWPFSHETMTMSVRVTSRGKSFCFCKGSFESVSARAQPSKAGEIASGYSARGFYVLAVGCKAAAAEESREEAETGLVIIALLLFRNEPKSDSAAALAEMNAAGLSIVMVTGDHVLTGVAISREVGLIGKDDTITVYNPSTVKDDGTALAVCGDSLEYLIAAQPELLPRVRIFGRVSPSQKILIVRALQSSGRQVAMCGDGGNDSGALRVAHAGLALSGRAEASVAAPFSTDSDSLSALVLLIREARASTSTSLSAFCFLLVASALNSSGQTLLLLDPQGFFSSVAFIYADMVTIPLLLWAICQSRPSAVLACVSPDPRLHSWSMIWSCGWGYLCHFSAALVLFTLLVHQNWFEPYVNSTARLSDWSGRGNNFETATVYLWLLAAISSLALGCGLGGLHREAWYYNKSLCACLAVCSGICLALVSFGSSHFTCAFKINCDKRDYYTLQDSWINWFLLSYEKVGGPEWDGVVDSTVFPWWWKLVMIAFFSGMVSMYLLVIIRVQRWVSNSTTLKQPEPQVIGKAM